MEHGQGGYFTLSMSLRDFANTNLRVACPPSPLRCESSPGQPLASCMFQGATKTRTPCMA